MRIRCVKCLTLFLVALNVLIVYYSWKLIILENFTNSTTWFHIEQQPQKIVDSQTTVKSSHHKNNPQKLITVVFREFYDFENDLKASIETVTKHYPQIKVVVVSDDAVYPPPVDHPSFGNTSMVRFVNLNVDLLDASTKSSDPMDEIEGQYVLFLPDSVRLMKKGFLSRLLKFAVKIESTNILKRSGTTALEKWMLIIPVNVTGSSLGSSLNNCVKLDLNFPDWTLTYTSISSSSNISCDLLTQKHGIMVKTQQLREMLSPFSSPFPEHFHIQSSKLFNVKKYIYNESLAVGRKLFESGQSKKLKNERLNEQLRKMYKWFKIKRVVRNQFKINATLKRKSNKRTAGSESQIIIKVQEEKRNPKLANYRLHTTVQNYGCEKSTRSCIGKVVNEKPYYLYINRNLPPCCRDKLVSVFQMVIEEFERTSIRYWLDNNALQNAVDLNGALSPVDFEIDISFNAFDVNRSSSLKKSHYRPFSDQNGLHWLKAIDGNYFKVFFSSINRIGVNLLPFDCDSRLVTAKGFTGKKAKSFSVDFLHPMSTVLFLNRTISCPNNVRDFLEINQNS